TAGTLGAFSSAGSISLASVDGGGNPLNDVATFAASAGGVSTLTYRDLGALAIGAVGASGSDFPVVTGASTGGGNILVQSTGALTINNAFSAGAGGILLRSGGL